MIILIILATVTISSTIGDNGLIKQAEKTKGIATNSIAKENEDLNRLEQEYANMMAEDGEIPEPPKDTTGPTVTITPGEITENSIAVTVNAVDDESGLAESRTYKYYLNGAEQITDTANSYTFTGLTAGTEYTIKVEAFDKAGNKGENSVTATTKTNSNSVESILEEGKYVNYVDGTNVTRKCVVLYGPENEKYSSYGIQIIPIDTVEEVELGSSSKSNYNENRDLYNVVISYINITTQKYLNTTYAEKVRCVGSVPDNPSYDEAGMYEASANWFSSYNRTLKDKDENYKTDYYQMQALNNLHDINKNYWLASRSDISSSSPICFGVRFIDSDGRLNDNDLWRKYSGGGPYAYSGTNGLRPVFTLKSEIKVTGGDGTPEHPYELGV